MKTAKLTVDQATQLDPAFIPPGHAIAIRYGDLQAVIGPLPSADTPAPMLIGELRDNNGDPVYAEDIGPRVKDIIRTEVATPEGLRLLLAALERLAHGRRQAS